MRKKQVQVVERFVPKSLERRYGKHKVWCVVIQFDSYESNFYDNLTLEEAREQLQEYGMYDCQITLQVEHLSNI